MDVALADDDRSSRDTAERKFGLPEEWSMRLIIQEVASLLDKHGGALADAPLVLPTAKFFPDAIEPSQAGVTTLFTRMLSYSPLPDDLAYELAFISPEDAGSCSTGACGPAGEVLAPLMETDETYVVPVDVRVASNSVRITTSLARSVGALILAFADDRPKQVGAASELTACMAGFGVLLANGSHQFVKSCGGAKLMQNTELAVEDQVFALALFTKLGDHSESLVRKHLAATQKEAFDASIALLSDNQDLLDTLGESPALLSDGVFTLKERKGFLGKLLG
jgi:hypothetical protein